MSVLHTYVHYIGWTDHQTYLLVALQRYLGKYDSLSIQDKLSLVDDLKEYHISGLKRGIKSLDCLYIENNVPYSGFILQGFKCCELPTSQHLILQENYLCRFLELVVYLW